jgi:uracil-DNA glycosylase family 4
VKRTYVHPSGPREAKLGICGEQPGVHEVRGNPPRPFIGPAGQLLDECLAMAKILRRDLYFTNVIKDLDNPLSHYINLDFKKQKYEIFGEGLEYIKELREELSKLHLNAIVAFGNVSLIALTSRMGISKWTGSVLESTLVQGLKVIPAPHPATVLPPKFNFLNKPLICEALSKADNESKFPEIRREEREVYTELPFERCVKALNYCYELGMRGQTISFDIEVINGEVDCFSLGWDVHRSVSIPLRHSQGNYFNPEQELEIMRLLAKIIQEERITKVGANIIFDLQFVFRKYGIRPRGTIHCTQIAQKILLPDYPAGLDFVTQSYTDIPYYKADGKDWMKLPGSTSWQSWWEYNGMDAIVPIEAFPKQYKLLEAQGNLQTYERQRKLIEPLIYMGERGIRVDVQGMLAYEEEQRKELEALAEELNREVGHEINYNSPQQLMNYFYKECKIKPYKKRAAEGGSRDTTDIDALKRIFRLNVKGSRAARLMLDIRSLSKRISTYLNIGKVDKDGRYRSSYKPVGAETGRLSSGQTIFGTGGNQQNWPHDLLRFFLADEGYIFYSLDLSQIENRIVAYVGGVISQIEAFEQGIDLHKMTASVIFGKPYDEISSQDGSSTLGDGRQSERYWGKKGNHAVNYDVGYKKFGLVNELPEAEAKWILEKIHKGYPQIRGGYHAIVQEMLKKDRTVTNLYGRKRLFLGPIFPDRNTPISQCETTYREGYAQIPQSTTADKVNEYGVEYVYYNQEDFRHVELLCQVHDALGIQIPLSCPWTYHAEVILKLKKSLELPLTWHNRKFETPVDLSIGLNLCKEDMIEYKSKSIPNGINELAEKLEEAYRTLRSPGSSKGTP